MSEERIERLYQTYLLLEEGLSKEEIAIELGVGSNTISTYISEINSNREHFEDMHQERIAEEKREKREEIRRRKRLKQEEIRRKNETLEEIIPEEISRSFKWGFGLTILLYVLWWLPSGIFYVFTSGSIDITEWVYGNNFFIVLLVISLIIYIYLHFKEFIF